jgi:wyosine [tRNA(Phe)-imidazoG37] synthetase (radical SAM superfamily)
MTSPVTSDMKHVFGPVRSRRLGRSLGIDPVPLKTCNFNCVYCQLGRTPRLASRRHRFFDASEMLAEVATAVARLGPDAVDWITFVGSGETTLHSHLGYLVRMVKAATGLPVAVITNGSLLALPRVRRELTAADAVLPSLDAGSEDVYLRINRPHRAFPFADHLMGLERFRGEYEHALWVEVMLVRGLNDTEQSLRDIASCLRRISPDEVHISVPERPPSEAWIQPPEPETLARAASLLGKVARVLEPVEVAMFEGDDPGLAAALLAVVTRHPLRERELLRLLERWRPGHVTETLDSLASSGSFQIVDRLGERFWCSTGSRFKPAANDGDLVQ